MELGPIISRPGFWDDNESAQKFLKEQTGLQQAIDGWKKCNSSLDDARGLYEMALEEKDDGVALDVEGGAYKTVRRDKRGSSSGGCSQALMTTTTPSLPYILVQAVQSRRTGRKCF